MKQPMVDQLLSQLKLRGLSIKPGDGDTLLLCGDAKEKTPEIMAAVKAFKPFLLQRLRTPSGLPERLTEVHHAPPAFEPEKCTLCKAMVCDPAAGAICLEAKCPYRAGGRR